MKKHAILAYIVCASLIICTWIISFLPTIFYIRPVKLPKEEANLSSLPQLKPSFPCNHPLIFHNGSGFCKPPCDWLPYNTKEQKSLSFADWFTATLCFTCFCFVLVTWFQLPEFIKFPHYIILLMAGIAVFIELIVIIPKMGDPQKFFCSNPFLDESVKKPTKYCESQGFLVHYCSLLIGELFVVYNAVLLKDLVLTKLPKETYSKTFIGGLFLALFVLPIFPPLYVLKYGENYVTIMLRYCFPKNDKEAYYTTLLPLQFFIAIATTCLLLVVFKLIKERKSKLIASPSQARRRQIQIQKISIQFIMAIISYIICHILSYGVICIRLHNRKAFEYVLKKYFGCLIFMKKCPEDFKRYNVSYGVMLLMILAAIVFQGGTFILLAGKPTVRRLWRTWWQNITGIFTRAGGELPSSNTSSSVKELEVSSVKEKNNKSVN